MNWAKLAIRQLEAGQQAIIVPKGNSMLPLVPSGATVVLEPNPKNLAVGDVVLVTVGGKTYLHLIKAISGDQYQIGNNKGGINGWSKRIHGRATTVNNVEIKKDQDS